MVRTIINPKMDHKDCKGCFITKAVPLKEKCLLKTADFQAVDRTQSNTILHEILKHSLTKETHFIILARGNRYRIKIINRIGNMVYLTQEYMHLDSINKKLVPVMIRLVKIKL